MTNNLNGLDTVLGASAVPVQHPAKLILVRIVGGIVNNLQAENGSDRADSWKKCVEALVTLDRRIAEEIHGVINDVASIKFSANEHGQSADLSRLVHKLQRIERNVFPEVILKQGLLFTVEECMRSEFPDVSLRVQKSATEPTWLSVLERVLVYKIIDHTLIRLKDAGGKLERIAIESKTEHDVEFALVLSANDDSTVLAMTSRPIWTLLKEQATLVRGVLEFEEDEFTIRLMLT